MHNPRPHGLLAVGGSPSDEDEAAIELLARRLTNLRTLSGVGSLRMVRALPDGGYVIAQDMGGVFRVITHKPAPLPPPAPFDGIARADIPMLFSGVITRALLRDDQGVGIRLSQGTRRRIAGYAPNNLPAQEVALQRFRIEYHHQVSEFAPLLPSVTTPTQYVQQRPTWYSGAMAEVMQIVGGYGRQDQGNLPDDPVERARMILPQRVYARVLDQLGNMRLPGYTGAPPKNGQFQYDYKFHHTHGVGFDARGRPWLLRVSAAGVWAMPLPLVPATTTAAFRDYVDKVGDDEIIAILDRFGGMPSGESFPSDDGAFEAWRRAGVIIKVCDTADFYGHAAYASTCGWSFNLQGSEGCNTCYDYDQEGVGYGLTYKLRLALGAALDDGRMPPALRREDPREAVRMDAYLSALYERLRGNDARALAIKYKLRRLPEQVIERMGNPVTDAEVEYWDGLEAPPIATHAGNVAQVGRGGLYHGATFKNQPQIKFPEPFMGGCVSHDFLPLPSGESRKYPNCDTIMFAYYVGSQLKAVKYFREGRTWQSAVESNYEDCMTVGSWEQRATTGATSLLGHFYTSDFDERQAASPVETTTRIVGKDLGYDRVPRFAFDAMFWRPGTIWRNRYFSHQTSVSRTEGKSLSVAVCVPYLCRNALLHAFKSSTTGTWSSESLEMHSVQDPTTYRYWTQHPAFAWNGGLDVMNGRPYPKDGNPVWVEIENYGPYPCSDFADQGSWIPGLPADYAWLVHPDANVWKLSGGGGAPVFRETSSSSSGPGVDLGNLRISMLDEAGLVHSRIPDSTFFLGSPDEFGFVFYRDACRVTFGKTEYASVSETEWGERRRWGHTSLADNKSAHHFIGVINE